MKKKVYYKLNRYAEDTRKENGQKSYDKRERNARSVGRPNSRRDTWLLGISWVDGKFQDEEKIV